MSDRICSAPTRARAAAVNDEVLRGLGAEACAGLTYWKKRVQLVLKNWILAPNVLEKAASCLKMSLEEPCRVCRDLLEGL